MPDDVPHYDDEDRPAPVQVVTAVGFGTMPLPFLAVYAVLFLIHGSIKPINPPDITSSTTGELLAGVVALIAFVVTAVALLWFLNARRRWPFAMVETVLLVVAIDFLVDDTKGGRAVSLLVALSCLVALVFGFAPASWQHVGQSPPPVVAGLYRDRPTDPRDPTDPGGGTALAHSTPPTRVKPALLRRRGRGA